MHRTIRPWMRFSLSAGKSCPRVLFAFFLILAFGITHVINILAMQIVHDLASDKLAQNGYAPELPPPEQVKFPITRPVVSANGLDPLIVESLNKTLSNWLRYFYDPNLSQSPAELLDRYQSVYEEQQAALQFLHQIRLSDPELFAQYAQAFPISLERIYFISSRHCMETGDTITSANLLGDLLQLRKVLASPPTPVMGFGYPGIYDSIPKLGARLKPNDPARPNIEQLIKELLDDSEYQYAYRDQAAVLLILQDNDVDPFKLLNPFKKRHYAKLVDASLSRLRQIQNGNCNDYDFTRELQSIPFFIKNSSINLYDTYGTYIRKGIPFPENSAKNYDPQAAFDLLNNDQNILDEIESNHLTAVALACQLYRIDHGVWPAKLDDLSPKYLPLPPQSYARADDKLVLYRISYESGDTREALISLPYPLSTFNKPLRPNLFTAYPYFHIDLIPSAITDFYHTAPASVEPLTPP